MFGDRIFSADDSTCRLTESRTLVQRQIIIVRCALHCARSAGSATRNPVSHRASTNGYVNFRNLAAPWERDPLHPLFGARKAEELPVLFQVAFERSQFA